MVVVVGFNDTSIRVDRLDTGLWGKTARTANTHLLPVSSFSAIIFPVASMGAKTTKGYTKSDQCKGISTDFSTSPRVGISASY
jgi:hypothetical protein